VLGEVDTFLRPDGAITIDEWRSVIARVQALSTSLFTEYRTREVLAPFDAPVLLARNGSAHQLVVRVARMDGLIGCTPNLFPGSNPRVGSHVALLYPGEELWYKSLDVLATSVRVSEVVP
jgi:hypothetical protein